MTTFITVAIPYVNADPHIGYAFELIEADLAARARRALGEPVRFLGGTDDHSLKNVLAAEATGDTTEAFVTRHGDRFEALARSLDITFDDFIRTSSDPRHRPAVERLWNACARAGDLYRREYSGSYCVGCEQFYDPDELVDGGCPEHGQVVDTVTETNWFFRLSRHTERLIDLIETNELRISPDPFRAEVLAFARRGLDDISVSRSSERARGWGLAVPDDPTQVVSVWFDALTNYISALEFGTDGDQYRRWWRDADERIHVIGKGITRFHALYWPAFLLSAGEPVPTHVHVHPYLSVDGTKVPKSSGSGPAPVELVDAFGVDALRWWVTSDVSPTSDTDFTVDRLVLRANETLANGFGNAISRIATLRRRLAEEGGSVRALEPEATDDGLRVAVATALAAFDRRRAALKLASAIHDVNHQLETSAPWRLLGDPSRSGELTDVLHALAAALDQISTAIGLVAPSIAARSSENLRSDPWNPTAPVYRRLANGIG